MSQVFCQVPSPDPSPDRSGPVSAADVNTMLVRTTGTADLFKNAPAHKSSSLVSGNHRLALQKEAAIVSVRLRGAIGGGGASQQRRGDDKLLLDRNALSSFTEMTFTYRTKQLPSDLSATLNDIWIF